MKSLKNKTVMLAGTEIQYSQMVAVCAKKNSDKGHTVDDIRLRIQIIDIAEKANGIMDFNEEQVKKLKECVKVMNGWAIIEKSIVDFTDDVEKI